MTYHIVFLCPGDSTRAMLIRTRLLAVNVRADLFYATISR
jgi:hypothetical protein